MVGATAKARPNMQLLPQQAPRSSWSAGCSRSWPTGWPPGSVLAGLSPIQNECTDGDGDYVVIKSRIS